MRMGYGLKAPTRKGLCDLSRACQFEEWLVKRIVIQSKSKNTLYYPHSTVRRVSVSTICPVKVQSNEERRREHRAASPSDVFLMGGSITELLYVEGTSALRAYRTLDLVPEYLVHLLSKEVREARWADVCRVVAIRGSRTLWEAGARLGLMADMTHPFISSVGICSNR